MLPSPLPNGYAVGISSALQSGLAGSSVSSPDTSTVTSSVAGVAPTSLYVVKPTPAAASNDAPFHFIPDWESMNLPPPNRIVHSQPVYVPRLIPIQTGDGSDGEYDDDDDASTPVRVHSRAAAAAAADAGDRKGNAKVAEFQTPPPAAAPDSVARTRRRIMLSRRRLLAGAGRRIASTDQPLPPHSSIPLPPQPLQPASSRVESELKPRSRPAHGWWDRTRTVVSHTIFVASSVTRIRSLLFPPPGATGLFTAGGSANHHLLSSSNALLAWRARARAGLLFGSSYLARLYVTVLRPVLFGARVFWTHTALPRLQSLWTVAAFLSWNSLRVPAWLSPLIARARDMCTAFVVRYLLSYQSIAQSIIAALQSAARELIASPATATAGSTVSAAVLQQIGLRAMSRFRALIERFTAVYAYLFQFAVALAVSVFRHPARFVSGVAALAATAYTQSIGVRRVVWAGATAGVAAAVIAYGLQLRATRRWRARALHLERALLSFNESAWQDSISQQMRLRSPPAPTVVAAPPIGGRMRARQRRRRSLPERVSSLGDTAASEAGGSSVAFHYRSPRKRTRVDRAAADAPAAPSVAPGSDAASLLPVVSITISQPRIDAHAAGTGGDIKTGDRTVSAGDANTAIAAAAKEDGPTPSSRIGTGSITHTEPEVVMSHAEHRIANESSSGGGSAAGSRRSSIGSHTSFSVVSSSVETVPVLSRSPSGSTSAVVSAPPALTVTLTPSPAPAAATAAAAAATAAATAAPAPELVRPASLFGRRTAVDAANHFTAVHLSPIALVPPPQQSLNPKRFTHTRSSSASLLPHVQSVTAVKPDRTPRDDSHSHRSNGSPIKPPQHLFRSDHGSGSGSASSGSGAGAVAPAHASPSTRPLIFHSPLGLVSSLYSNASLTAPAVGAVGVTGGGGSAAYQSASASASKAGSKAGSRANSPPPIVRNPITMSLLDADDSTDFNDR